MLQSNGIVNLPHKDMEQIKKEVQMLEDMKSVVREPILLVLDPQVQCEQKRLSLWKKIDAEKAVPISTTGSGSTCGFSHNSNPESLVKESPTETCHIGIVDEHEPRPVGKYQSSGSGGLLERQSS